MLKWRKSFHRKEQCDRNIDCLIETSIVCKRWGFFLRVFFTVWCWACFPSSLFQVFINCAGFIKIHADELSDAVTGEQYVEPLDASRVHPEAYEWARKMAVDALDMDESVDGANPSDALVEVLEKPSVLNDLDLRAFADELKGMEVGEKFTTLNDILRELHERFHETRPLFKSPSEEEVFEMIVGEPVTEYKRGRMLAPTVSHSPSFKTFPLPMFHRVFWTSKLFLTHCLKGNILGWWECAKVPGIFFFSNFSDQSGSRQNARLSWTNAPFQPCAFFFPNFSDQSGSRQNARLSWTNAPFQPCAFFFSNFSDQSGSRQNARLSWTNAPFQPCAFFFPNFKDRFSTRWEITLPLCSRHFIQHGSVNENEWSNELLPPPFMLCSIVLYCRPSDCRMVRRFSGHWHMPKVSDHSTFACEEKSTRKEDSDKNVSFSLFLGHWIPVWHQAEAGAAGCPEGHLLTGLAVPTLPCPGVQWAKFGLWPHWRIWTAARCARVLIFYYALVSKKLLDIKIGCAQ